MKQILEFIAGVFQLVMFGAMLGLIFGGIAGMSYLVFKMLTFLISPILLIGF